MKCVNCGKVTYDNDLNACYHCYETIYYDIRPGHPGYIAGHDVEVLETASGTLRVLDGKLWLVTAYGIAGISAARSLPSGQIGIREFRGRAAERGDDSVTYQDMQSLIQPAPTDDLVARLIRAVRQCDEEIDPTTLNAVTGERLLPLLTFMGPDRFMLGRSAIKWDGRTQNGLYLQGVHGRIAWCIESSPFC